MHATCPMRSEDASRRGVRSSQSRIPKCPYRGLKHTHLFRTVCAAGSRDLVRSRVNLDSPHVVVEGPCVAYPPRPTADRPPRHEPCRAANPRRPDQSGAGRQQYRGDQGYARKNIAPERRRRRGPSSIHQVGGATSRPRKPEVIARERRRQDVLIEDHSWKLNGGSSGVWESLEMAARYSVRSATIGSTRDARRAGR
jgi:hypothetical protein